jgi:hypothetical protein
MLTFPADCLRFNFIDFKCLKLSTMISLFDFEVIKHSDVPAYSQIFYEAYAAIAATFNGSTTSSLRAIPW